MHAAADDALETYELVAVFDTDVPVTPDDLADLSPTTRQHLVVVDLAYEHGLELSMMAAAQIAVGDFVIEVDAPSENFPSEALEHLLTFSREHAVDIVGAVPADAPRRTSSTFYRLLELLGVSTRRLNTESVRLVSRRALNRVLTDRRRLRFRKLLYVQSGFEYRQIVIEGLELPPSAGMLHRVGFGIDLLATGSKIGSVAAAIMSAFFLVLSLSLGVYAVVVKLSGVAVVPGWTSIMAFLSVTFAGFFGVLFLMARTLSVLVNEVVAPAPFAVREVFRP